MTTLKIINKARTNVVDPPGNTKPISIAHRIDKLTQVLTEKLYAYSALTPTGNSHLLGDSHGVFFSRSAELATKKKRQNSEELSQVFNRESTMNPTHDQIINVPYVFSQKKNNNLSWMSQPPTI
ncbi:hypothetical protein FRX31_021798 [Thalictrum thalictroides]|uniref:Uncharacterized protein n=1 Tax=Thalictrum thalictroides TaxID=46969 RepID=A0A7J6VWQ3_THATH|nr:hypothetical protein FRX31_021798 [Thalictrum thalictroides]